MMDRRVDERKRPVSNCGQTLPGSFLVGIERNSEFVVP
jgi:hypothetical protein